MKSTRRSFLIGSAALAAAGGASAQVGDVRPREHLRVQGRERTYRLVAPRGAGAGSPLMIALHGMGIDSISLMPAYSGLDDLARAENFVLAYPASLENNWPLSFGPKLNTEMAYFDALVNHLVRGMSLDPRRIYLVGMSNGGYFANVIASRRGRFIAGLGVHSGSAGVLALGRINSPRKFPVYISHGDADLILTVQNGRDQAALYRRENHPVLYEEVAGMGHIWATDPTAVNQRMWRFWAQNATR